MSEQVKQRGVRTDHEPQPAQRRACQRHQQCRQQGPVFGSQLRALTSELTVQDTQLVAEGENLDVLLVVGHR
jgi:hypothetical protein